MEKNNNGKTETFKMRLTWEDRFILKHLSKTMNMSMTDILIKGLHLVAKESVKDGREKR